MGFQEIKWALNNDTGAGGGVSCLYDEILILVLSWLMAGSPALWVCCLHFIEVISLTPK